MISKDKSVLKFMLHLNFIFKLNLSVMLSCLDHLSNSLDFKSGNMSVFYNATSNDNILRSFNQSLYEYKTFFAQLFLNNQTFKNKFINWMVTIVFLVIENCSFYMSQSQCHGCEVHRGIYKHEQKLHECYKQIFKRWLAMIIWNFKIFSIINNIMFSTF